MIVMSSCLVDHVRSCDFVAPRAFIVYAESTSYNDDHTSTLGSLQRIPIGSTSYSAHQTTLVPQISNPVALEFYHIDDFNGYVYWSNPGDGYIGRVRFDGSNSMRIVTNVKTDSLAVDWISRNLYWVEYEEVYNLQEMKVERIVNFSIAVSRLDGRYRKKLITSELGRPRSVVVLPKQGYVANNSNCVAKNSNRLCC